MDKASTLAVIVFSKDRPCQLLCSLASLRHLRGVTLDVSVLYKASADFQDSYTVVKGLLGRGLYHLKAAQFHWMEECKENTLGQLLDKVLVRIRERASAVLLTVDDALWFDDFDAASALKLLQDDRIYSVHAKLCPRIEYAHPNNKFMRLPPFCSRELFPDSSDFLIFERCKGEYDWNYPWELSASLYRLDALEETLNAVRSEFGPASTDHPNHLEGYGNRLAKQQRLRSASGYCACVKRPVVVVVTINRVQSLFQNPVYSGESGESEISPKELDQVFRCALVQSVSVQGDVAGAAKALAAHLDMPGMHVEWWTKYLDGVETPRASWDMFELTSWPPRILGKAAVGYASTYWDRVHVPLTTSVVEIEAHLGPLVSWLMPVKDTPRAWLEKALGSVESQEFSGSWELICVDDASSLEETLQTLEDWKGRPNVRVVRLGVGGCIARALNEGWRHCRGRYVARLDGDDYADPQRLQKQIGFLERHRSISILGGGFVTFNDAGPLKQYRMPCHPILARWHMLFSCSLAHPTVTFRHSSFKEAPYSEAAEAEDHHCWLAQPLELHLANLGDSVCFLRRHRASRSACAARALRASSLEAVRSFISKHMHVQIPVEVVEVLWGAKPQLEQVDAVSKTIDWLEGFFLKMIQTGATSQGMSFTEDFNKDFLGARRSALEEFVSASCNKLRGMLTVQSLASGEVDLGAAMMKNWLKGGDAGLKSLGALIQSGYS